MQRFFYRHTFIATQFVFTQKVNRIVHSNSKNDGKNDRSKHLKQLTLSKMVAHNDDEGGSERAIDE